MVRINLLPCPRPRYMGLTKSSSISRLVPFSTADAQANRSSFLSTRSNQCRVELASHFNSHDLRCGNTPFGGVVTKGCGIAFQPSHQVASNTSSGIYPNPLSPQAAP